ncbi:YigZ family protein [Lachnospiraceae bacterium 48-21]|nr:YigZ family protein [Dorea sp.]
MLPEYKTVYRGGEGEITEKKSRFIANVVPVSSEEEAEEFIESMKKKYWDARHNCYAYIIGERGEIKRFSDDGEPGGTAGKPILEVLAGEGITNAAIVVTRYFGGTLLGTGGLVRAYGAAAKEGLSASAVINKIPGMRLSITTDYTGLGKIQYLLGQRGITVLDTVYTDKVEMEALVSLKEGAAVKAEITEGTNGQAVLQEGEPCYLAKIDGKMQIV